jgi:outer membrane protein insertion porin family
MRNFYAYAGLGYADNQSDINSDSSFATTNPLLYSDKYNKISGLAGIKFDNTDDFYVPRSGFIASAGVELAQLGGDINSQQIDAGYTDYGDFAKFNAKFGAYYGLNDLIDYDLILRYKARYNKIVSGSNNGYIPVSERLFLGGNGSVRGFDSYSISPQRTITSGTPPVATTGNIGGTQTFSNSIEASIPISEEAKMRLALFADYGTISTDNYYGEAYPSMSRKSVGAAIEWFSPFGPVNFIFAKAINPEALDKTATFEFSMGTKF